jgi:hypothetical protein
VDRIGLAVASGLAVGILGGLIGLGGAEFRLPLLVALFAYTLRQAIPLNLAISLVAVVMTAISGALVWAIVGGAKGPVHHGGARETEPSLTHPSPRIANVSAGRRGSRELAIVQPGGRGMALLMAL